MTIQLTKNKFAIVDKSDFEYLNQWKWHYNSGYAERKEYKNGKQYHVKMHRVLCKGKLIDHINGDKLDNRKSNLRSATHSQNAMNMRKHRGKSVYKGVSQDRGYWRTTIWKNNKIAFRTSAKKERWAAMIYDLNATALFGKYARLNFPNSLRGEKTADELL